MKKGIVTLACLVATVNFAYSQTEKPQIEKGSGILSLDVPFSISGSSSTFQNNGPKYNSVSFTYTPFLSGGYFVTRNFMIGANLGMQHGLARSKNGLDPVQKFSNPVFLNTGIMLRYYHFFNPKFGIYGQFTANYIRQMNKTQTTGGTMNGVSIGWAPRLVYLPKPNLGINLGFGELNYTHRRQVNNGNTTFTGNSFNFLPSFNVGVSYFFRKK
jgi:hypothetical protein